MNSKHRFRVVAVGVAALMLLASPAFAFNTFIEELIFGHAFVSSPQSSESLAAQEKVLRMKVQLSPDDEENPPEVDAPYCYIGRTVHFQRFKKSTGTWKTVGKQASNNKGIAKFDAPDKPGKYRARLKALPAPNPEGYDCFAEEHVLGRHKH